MAILKVTTLTDKNDSIDLKMTSLRNAIQASNPRSQRNANGIDTQFSRSIAPTEVKSSSFCTLMAALATKL